ncbi:hypothetical protein CBQ28_15005 [Pseudoalteromonas sp. GCY]|uniref:sensor histidine kinase n=1 Tax=Pseudoalteromonas sp. GCY TaxID=2003316 RepID=UPI000BFEE13D|nr:ATP-binding protein [Pseudoalteromonas sp. GCY]PHI36314.1 hypothetical protein CBQ28_15005 [Pseudoalteromonas sp. GCY]QQQ66926.1 hypothetical protein JJQ94_22195 [Pseudoalteromonas sp. GCY]
MRKQFIRLYIFIIFSVIAVLIAFGQIYQNYVFESPPSITLPITEWSKLVADKTNTLITLQRNELALPADLERKLSQQQMLTVIQEGKNYIYIKDLNKSNEAIYRIGPITIAPNQEEHSVYFMLAYSTIALLVMAFIWPVFKDLAKLEHIAKRFSQDKKPFPPALKSSSTVYSLAQSLSEMSTQISLFIRLHEDLSRIISHEIRTPLSRMRFMLSLDEVTDEELRQTIKRNVDEIENRLTQYLDFARVEYLTLPIHFEQLDAQEFINREVQKNNLFTRIDIKTSILTNSIYCEPNSFAILVQNLLFNAVKYAQKQVSLTLKEADCEQVLEIYDDGAGLPKDAASLLTPFSSTTHSNIASGYGLGLYIVERICIWHAGNLTLRNHDHTGGAYITVKWPIKKR